MVQPGGYPPSGPVPPYGSPGDVPDQQGWAPSAPAPPQGQFGWAPAGQGGYSGAPQSSPAIPQPGSPVAAGYPGAAGSPQQGYPAGQQSSPGYPQQGGYAGQQSSPGIPQQGYPGAQQSSPGIPQQSGYPGAQQSSPGIPQQQGGYPAGQQSSPGYPQQGGYAGQQSSPDIPQQAYPGAQQSSPGIPQQGYPGAQQSSPGLPQQGAYPGAQQSSPGYPGAQGANEPDPPGLTIDASYSPFAFLLAITKPKIQVNGQQVPVTRWGPNHVPVGPGQHHVRVSTPWLFDMGPATATVPVNPGQGTRVYYKAPVVILLNGAIGPVPQKAPGLLFLYITWGFVALIFLLNLIVLVGVASA